MCANHFRHSALAFAAGWLLLFPALPAASADRVCDAVPEDPPQILEPEGVPDARLLEFGKIFSERIVGKNALPEERARLLSLFETTPHSRTLLPFVIASLGERPTDSPDFPRLAGIAKANPSADLLNLTLGELLLSAPKKETDSEKAARLEQAYGFLFTAFRSLTDNNGTGVPKPNREMRHAFLKYVMVCLLQGKESELEAAVRRMKSVPAYHDDPDISAVILLAVLSRMEKAARPFSPLPTGPLPDKSFSLQCDFSEDFPHFLERLADARFTDTLLPGQLASILVRKGKTEELRQALLSWILLTGGAKPEPFELLAAVEEMSGSLMTAGRLAENILASGKAKNPVRLIFAAANTYLNAGAPRRALALLNRYGSRVRDKAALARLYVSLYLTVRDIPSALKATAPLPEDHAKYIQRMLMQKELKQWREAAESGKKALEFIRKNKLKLRQNIFYLAYAEVLEKLGDAAGIRAVLEPLIREDPENPDLLNFLGYVLADHNLELDHAEKLIVRALRKKPDNAAILDSMAWVLYRKGRFPEAKKFILQSLEQCKDREDPTLLDHAGDIFKALGDGKKAVDFWRRALRLLEETGSDPDLEKAVRKKLAPSS